MRKGSLAGVNPLVVVEAGESDVFEGKGKWLSRISLRIGDLVGGISRREFKSWRMVRGLRQREVIVADRCGPLRIGRLDGVDPQ